MNVPVQLQTPPESPVPKWWQSLQRIYQQVAKTINGNISFGNLTSGSANIAGKWTMIVTPVASNTDFIVTHNLGYPVAGYLVTTKNAPTDVYTSPSANALPNTQVILRATTASVTITIFLF